MRIKSHIEKMAIRALAALLLAPWLSLISTPAAAGVQPLYHSPHFAVEENLPIISDFDGDCLADESKLFSNGSEKTIQLKFANLQDSQLHFTSRGADRGRLFAVDIDGDGDVDLVWVSQSQEPADVVWLNDGKGNFDAAKDDTPYTGKINALLGTNDPSDESFTAGSCPTHILTSPSAPDVALLTTSRPANETKSVTRLRVVGVPNTNSTYLSDLRKRGPPSGIS